MNRNQISKWSSLIMSSLDTNASHQRHVYIRIATHYSDSSGELHSPAPRPVVAKSVTGKMVETFDARRQRYQLVFRRREHMHIRIHRQPEQRLGRGAKWAREKSKSKLYQTLASLRLARHHGHAQTGVWVCHGAELDWNLKDKKSKRE